jgi:spermidine synthase
LRRPTLPLLLAALFLSGIAGIVNQVAWQRGLKIFLGGSEALSSMTVVLVFMLGLGVGAGVFSTRAANVRNPLRALGFVELGLCAANILVGTLLSIDLSESIYAMQRAAVGAGIPLRALYVAGAVLILGAPCFLMGVTIPLSSEACQRQLGRERASLVNVLLFVNTTGAVLGALASGFYLLPRFGQTTAIGVAAAMNAVAGLIALAIARGAVLESGGVASALHTALRPTREDLLGFVMGLLSLAYEMYLFRAMALGHEPLPYTFASVLCGFLLAWSLGVFLAYEQRPRQVAAALLASGLGVAVMPVLADFDRWTARLSITGATAMLCLPVIGFGVVYGGLVARNAKRWGSDVGRFGAWNTAGSCAGILLGTLVGYAMAPKALAWTIAAGLVVTFLFEVTRVPRVVRFVVAAAAIVLAAFLFRNPPRAGGTIADAVYDRDGVVEIDGQGNLVWDGLWHSHLLRGKEHLGKANWLMTVAPVLMHRGPVRDALVIGVGSGITIGTLAKSGDIQRIDAYDINRGLETILRRYPRRTMGVLRDPKVRLLWQDGRSGLALRDAKYDLITQQPLYLRQAGSSILLSREYFRLVQKRLRPGGVFAIYSNAFGNREQAHLVRETAASVFPHCATFDGGYLIIASNSPITASEESFRARLAMGDALGNEMAEYERRGTKLFSRLDRGATWTGGGYKITDDHPLIEYPRWTTALVRVK